MQSGKRALRGRAGAVTVRPVQSIRDKFRTSPVTAWLCASLVAAYMAEMVLQTSGFPRVFMSLALSRDGLDYGMWWTLVTHMFLHAHPLHLAVNVLGLWFIGPEVEFSLGRTRFLVLYFVSGVAGGALQTALAPSDLPLVGASGAVCGVLLSFTVENPEMPLQALLFFVLPVRMKARTLGRGLIVFSAACAALHVFPLIGHLAHLGGALAGAALTKYWNRRAALVPERPVPAASTDELLRRVMEGGIEGLSRDERRQLEMLAAGRRDRRGARRW